MRTRLGVAFGLALVASVVAYWFLTRIQTAFDAQGNDDANMTYRDSIRWFGEAISYAEGFPVAGSIPQRANNPGDLVIPNWGGQTLGAERISVFSSPAEGWRRLYAQLQLIVNGGSHVYTLNMTIREMAHKWTRTQPDQWAQNVANRLQSRWAYGDVTPDTVIGEILV